MVDEKSLKRKRFWIIFVVFFLSLLFWYQVKENERADRKVSLENQILFFRDLYRIDVPKEYFAGKGENRIRVKAAYPGMVGYSRKTIHRFVTKLPSQSDGLFITLRRVAFSTDEKDRFKNKNDPGRFYIESKISRFSSIKQHPLPEGIEESEWITRHTMQAFKSMGRYSGVFLIRQENGRISSITCLTISCTGKTTWKGDFLIEYSFKKKHFNKMVDLDRSIYALITDFNPRPKFIK
jgi:hypothetical protein